MQSKTMQWLQHKKQKLSTLSLDDFDCNEFMSYIKDQVKCGEVNKSICEHWGEMILYAWKIAADSSEIGTVDSGEVTKAKLEADIIQDLFYFSIIYSKKYAQRFSWIVDAFVPKLTSKRYNIMFFRCLLPILWRNLESVNEDVRLSASRLLLKFYPLRAEDDVVNAEYLQKQTVAMNDMLVDPCVPIRVEAIKKVLLHLRLHWSTFPRYLIKSYLAKIVDELSMDKVDEVRVAVYEGISHLLFCPQAKTATEHALQILCPRGINDRTVSVRMAAFKLLNSLISHRHFDCFGIVDMNDLLRRLDFENSESVQRQIVRLIFKSFCPIKVKNIDDRYVRVARMCKISRNASLNFHRHIYSLKLISCEEAKTHILGIVYGVKTRLLKNNYISERRPSESGGELESLLMNQTSNSTIDFTINSTLNGSVDEQQREEQKLHQMKDALDSAIVLWTTMRCDLHQKYPDNNENFHKIMQNILDRLKNHLNTPFVDSAMVIASNLPSRRISKSLQDEVLYSILRDSIDPIHLSGYIEALASWDPDRLAQLIIKGLDRLYQTVAIDTARPSSAADWIRLPNGLDRVNGNVIDATSLASNSDRDSPPMKRSRQRQNKSTKRKQIVGDDLVVPLSHSLKVLNLALSSPVALANLRGRDDFTLSQVAGNLKNIRKTFGIRLREGDLKSVEEIGLLANCYETLTMLSIISKPSKEFDEYGDNSGDEANSYDDSTLVEPMDTSSTCENNTETTIVENIKEAMNVRDRRLLFELKWMRRVMQEVQPPVQVIKMFLRCLSLHLDCCQLSLLTLKRATDLVIEIFQTSDMNYVGEEMRDCAKHLSEALEYCEEDDRLMIDGLMNRLKGLQNYSPDENDDEIAKY